MKARRMSSRLITRKSGAGIPPARNRLSGNSQARRLRYFARRNFHLRGRGGFAGETIQDDLAVGNRPLPRPRRFASARPRRPSRRRAPQDEARGKPPAGAGFPKSFPSRKSAALLNFAREEIAFCALARQFFDRPGDCAARRDHAGRGQMVFRHGLQLDRSAAVFSAVLASTRK